jgi:hypothetical protein
VDEVLEDYEKLEHVGMRGWVTERRWTGRGPNVEILHKLLIVCSIVNVLFYDLFPGLSEGSA